MLTVTMTAAGTALAQGFNVEDTGLNVAGKSAGYETNQDCLNDQTGGGCVPRLIGQVVNGLLGIFGALFLVLIMYGGFQYMTAGGDTGKVKAATQTIRNAILGMVVVASSYAISSFVLDSLGGATTGVENTGGVAPTE